MKNNEVLKATAWYTFSNFLLKGISFLTSPIFVRILTKTEYGTFSNILTWYSMISIIATMSLSATLVRARFDYENELNSYIKSNLIFGSFSTILISVVILLNSSYFNELMVIDSKYLIIMCLSIVVSPAYDIFLLIQRFQYKYKMVVVTTLGVTFSTVFLSLLFIYFWEDNLLARTVGNFLPTFVVSLIIYVYYITSNGRIKWQFCRYAITISIPYIFHLLSGLILESSDKAVITKIKGPIDNAYYSLAYSVGMVVNTIWSSMNSAFSPWLGEKLNCRDFLAIKKYSYRYVLTFAVLVVTVTLMAPEAMLIIGGKSYLVAKYCAPPIIGGYFFLFVYSMYVNIEQYEKKTMPMAIATGFAGGVNLFLNIVFVKMYGYVAAAYTTWLCYFLLFVFHYLVVRKMNMHIAYDTKFLIIISTIVCFVLMINSAFLYDYSIVRYIITGIWLIGGTVWLVTQRKQILI